MPVKMIGNLRYLSAEVVAGAAASAVLAAKTMHVYPGWAFYAALGLSVFILYQADHYMDGLRYKEESPRPSHHFFYRKRKGILLVLILALVPECYFISMLDMAVIKAGLLLAIPVVLYYAGIHLFRKRFLELIPGELVVALVYVGGTWSGPLVLAGARPSAAQSLALVLFLLVILVNVFQISAYSFHVDHSLGIRSLAVRLGLSAIRKWLDVLSILGITIYTVLILLRGGEAYLYIATIELLMLLLIRALAYFPLYFSKSERYRYYADSILLLGFLALLA